MKAMIPPSGPRNITEAVIIAIKQIMLSSNILAPSAVLLIV